MSQSLFRCLSHIITTEVLWNSFRLPPPQRSLFAWCLSVKTVLSDRRGEVSIFQIKIDFGATGICFSPIRAFVPCHLQDHIIPTQNKRIKCIMCVFWAVFTIEWATWRIIVLYQVTLQELWSEGFPSVPVLCRIVPTEKNRYLWASIVRPFARDQPFFLFFPICTVRWTALLLLQGFNW